MDNAASVGDGLGMDEEEALRIAAEQACRCDPLARLLLRVSHHSAWRMALMGVGIYAVLILAGGCVVSLVYQRAGFRFLSILDPRELGLALYVYLVVAPAIWSLYSSQPRWILEVFRDVGKSGVLVETKRSGTLDAFVQRTVNEQISNRHYSKVAVITAVVGFAIFLWTALRPGNPFFYGFPSVWWLINPVYLAGVWGPFVVLINVYMLAWIVFRQAIAIKSFSAAFGKFGVSPKLFHHDGANGFAALGNYGMASALIAVFFVLWMLTMTSYPMLFGGHINVTYITLPLAVSYLVGVPGLLIPPVWSAHLAMGKARAAALEKVAVELRRSLRGKEPENLPASKCALELLERKYRLLKEEYRTWPFNVPTLRRFSLAALMPLLSKVAMLLIEAYSR